MPIVDTHVHVVSADRRRYPVQDGAPNWPEVSAASLAQAMQNNGVDRALLVQSRFTYGFDNRFALDCARVRPDLFAVVAVVDQTAADAPDTLTRLVSAGVRGVRLMPHGLPPGVLSSPISFALWERAEQLAVPVTVAAEMQHLEGLGSVLRRFPAVTVCLEHMWGLRLERPLRATMAPLLVLARLANVHLKLTPTNAMAARSAGIEPRELFDLLLETFGPHRLMWGSNYPAHPAVFGDYADRLAVLRSDLAYLAPDDRLGFFGGNADRLWPRLDAELRA